MRSSAIPPLLPWVLLCTPAWAQTPDPASPPASTAASSPDAKVPQDSNPTKRAGGFSGATGVLRLGAASGLDPGLFRVSVGVDFFASDGFIRDGDGASRFGGVLGFAGSPVDYLELWLNVGLASTQSDVTQPTLLQSQGDLTFGAKGYYPIADVFSLGADLSVRALTAVDASGYGAVQVRPRFLATVDLLGLPDPIPLRAHLNFGYLYDGSDDLLDGADALGPAEQFALGISEFDRLVAGLAVEVPVQWVTPYLEYTIEIPLGYEATPGVVVEGSGLAPKQALDPIDQSFRPAATRVLPQRLTPGIRVNGLDPFSFDVAVEIGLTPDQTAGVPPVPPYNVVFLASYVLDPFGVRKDRGGGPAEAVSVPVLIPDAPAARARLTGRVVDQDSGAPLADAIVRFDRSSPVATDEEGRFTSQSLEGGPLQIRVELQGYEPGSATLDLPPDQEVEVEVALAPETGATLAGRVSGPSGPLADVPVRAVGPTSVEGRTGSDGRFELAVEPGSYRVVATPEGYLARGAPVEVTRGDRGQVDLSVQRGPSAARVDADRIALDAPLLFDADSAELSDAMKQSLADVADLLLRKPALRVSVEGHTDNRGDAEALAELSRQRAEAVKRALVDRGVAPDRLETRGFGPERPVAPNLTRRGRAQNNRVELTLTSAADS